MIYHNTLLSNSLKSPMQNLQSGSVRSDLPMSRTARKQIGLDAEELRIFARMNTCPNMITI